jgi:Uma2 family endonuclease
MEPPYHSYSYREYLELEASSNVKHEYFNGEIYAMAGGTLEHAALCAAVTTALTNELRGGSCRVYSSDLRIRVLATGLTAYPDAVVICGTPERDPESDLTATNPRLLVEVLSDGTASYDRGEKLAQYKQIDSVQAVLLFSQTSHRVELHERTEHGWLTKVFTGEHQLALPALDIELSIARVYADAGL